MNDIELLKIGNYFKINSVILKNKCIYKMGTNYKTIYRDPSPSKPLREIYSTKLKGLQ